MCVRSLLAVNDKRPQAPTHVCDPQEKGGGGVWVGGGPREGAEGDTR